MTKNIKNIVPLLLLMFLFSCQKDMLNLPESIKGDETYKVDVLGYVTDENDKPLLNVDVQYLGESKTTDINGFYLFEDIKVNSQHNFVSIEKQGYYKTTRTFRAVKDGNVTQKTILSKKDFKYSFNSESGGEIQNEYTTVSFPPNSIVVDDTGKDYIGEVLVSMKYLDPTKQAVDFIMPGDLTGTNANDDYLVLTSFGMNYVELQSITGSKLQMKDGFPATISSIIPDELLSDAPSVIDMWYFDYDLGLWYLEGSASLLGNRYVGTVSHFSCWNYDVSDPAIIISGRILDSDGNPVNCRIGFLNGSGLGGRGTTDHNGYFNGPVPKDQILEMTLWPLSASNCLNNTHFEKRDVGPFDTDRDLGDEIVNTIDELSYVIDANFIDCNLNKVNNVIVRVGRNIYLIDDGNLKLSFTDCSNDIIYLKAIDVDNLIESVNIQLNKGNNNLVDVGICNGLAPHISLNCDDLNVHEDLLFGAAIFKGQQGVTQNYFSAYSENESHIINLTYLDNSENIFSLGNFDVDSGGVEFIGWSDRRFTLKSGNVNIIQYNPIQAFVIGNYNIIVEDKNTKNEYNFYGGFKLEVR